MHDPTPAPNKPSVATYKDNDAHDDPTVRQPLNGACTKGGGGVGNVGVDEGEAGEEGLRAETTAEDVANGVGEPCLLQNNEDNIEDGADVPLRP